MSIAIVSKYLIEEHGGWRKFCAALAAVGYDAMASWQFMITRRPVFATTSGYIIVLDREPNERREKLPVFSSWPISIIGAIIDRGTGRVLMSRYGPPRRITLIKRKARIAAGTYPAPERDTEALY